MVIYSGFVQDRITEIVLTDKQNEIDKLRKEVEYLHRIHGGKMGNESYICDMRGFAAYHKTEERRESDVSSSLYHAFGENDRSRIDEIGDEKIRNNIYKVYDELIKLDIDCNISDACMATPPIMLGWSSVEKATPEKLEILKSILKEAGFIVTRLEKDRYITYG